MKKGILAKPKNQHEHDTTKFKLCVWYQKKLSGQFYTQYEKDENKNRKYHDSIDFIFTSGGYVTRHDVALQKLLDHLIKYDTHIERAFLYMNDFANDKQYLIGKFSKDKHTDKFIQPCFTHYEKLIYKEKIFFDVEDMQKFEIEQREFTTNQIFATGLIAPALNEFSLKHNKKSVLHK